MLERKREFEETSLLLRELERESEGEETCFVLWGRERHGVEEDGSYDVIACRVFVSRHTSRLRS